MLLRAGADPIRKNADGLTPLQLAEEHGKADVVGLLQTRIEGDIAAAAMSRRQAFLAPPAVAAPATAGEEVEWRKRRANFT